MKVKVRVNVDVDRKDIHSIKFNDRVLDTSNTTPGGVRLKKFIKKRILGVPIREYFFDDNVIRKGKPVLYTEIDIDVYPYIWKRVNTVPSDINPYTCELYPYPITKRNDISYEDYCVLQIQHLDYLKSLMKTKV